MNGVAYKKESTLASNHNALLLVRARTLVMAAGFAVFYAPAAYAIGSRAHIIWDVVAAFVCVLSLLLYLSNSKVSLRWGLLMLFLLSYYVVSTTIMQSDGRRSTLIFHLIKVAGFITLLELGLENNRDLCLKAFLIGSVCMCAWHYATFLMYRGYTHGMNTALTALYGELKGQHYFLLTHDNGSIFYFLPLLCGVWYQACEKNTGYPIAIIISVLMLYMYWSLWSVTAMIVTTTAVVLFIFVSCTDSYRLRSFLSYKRALAIGIIICAAIVLFHSSDHLSSIASNLGKANDFGRGRIWSRAIPYFKESPFFGVGFEHDATTTVKLGINHCHNIIVQVLYTGGLLTATFFLLGLLQCDVPSENRSVPITKAQAILCVTVICFFVAATFDWYLYMPIQFFPFVLYHFTLQDTPPKRRDERHNPAPINLTVRGEYSQQSR